MDTLIILGIIGTLIGAGIAYFLRGTPPRYRGDHR